MKKGDTVRIRKTDMVGTVTEVHTNSGRHYSVKFDNWPEIVLYEDEIELIPNIDSTLIVGCEVDGKLVGVAQCGRPVARALDDGHTVEVVRLCTDGTENACSFLYSRAARIAKEMGYSKIITYILDSENGASLRAAGWIKEVDIRGHTRNHPSRPRQTTAPVCDKQRWSKTLKNQPVADEAAD